MLTMSSLSILKAALAKIKASGQPMADIEPLLDLVEKAEAELLGEGNLQAKNENELFYIRANHDSQLEMLRSVIETAKIALSTSILINGGATVAILTLFSSFVGKGNFHQIAPPPLLVLSLVSFASGVLLGGIATGSSYCAQYCYLQENEPRGRRFRLLALLLVALSYVAFLTGIVFSYRTFTN